MNVSKSAMPKRGKRDKELRQQSLIEAATAVFAEHGYDAATTREVAERARCAEGLIHRYFGGKRGLLLAVCESKAADAMEAFKAGSPCDSVEEEVKQLLLLTLATFWEYPDFMRVSISQAIVDPEVSHAVRDRIVQQRILHMVNKLQPHKDASRIRDDVDLESVARIIVGLGFAMGFFGQVVLGMDRDYLRRVAAAAARVLSRGIAP